MTLVMPYSGRRTRTLICPFILGTGVPLFSERVSLYSRNRCPFSVGIYTLGAGFFFATPYHSWERGLCEHTNGLVRQYFAKGTDFREVRGDEVRRVEGLLNGRPRKVLEYRTPEEVFKKALALGG